jgi:hypothetical protein
MFTMTDTVPLSLLNVLTSDNILNSVFKTRQGVYVNFRDYLYIDQ